MTWQGATFWGRHGCERRYTSGSVGAAVDLAAGGGLGAYCVTAPRAAELTVAAYLDITPRPKGEAGGAWAAVRFAISSSVKSTSRRRASMSTVIWSPSWTAAIGPPLAASGATWPIIRPRVAPEKRPS